MSNSQPNADLLPRALAAIIDGLIGGILAAVIPILGGILGAAYILSKDALMFQATKNDQWKNKSVGKYLFKIHVQSDQADPIDWVTSIKRNWPLAIGTVVAIIPILGWVLGPLVAFVFSIIELVLVLTDPNRRRLGDRVANSRVVVDGIGM